MVTEMTQVGTRVVMGNVEFTVAAITNVLQPAGVTGDRIGKVVTIDYRLVNGLKTVREDHAFWYDEVGNFLRVTTR